MFDFSYIEDMTLFSHLEGRILGVEDSLQQISPTEIPADALDGQHFALAARPINAPAMGVGAASTLSEASGHEFQTWPIDLTEWGQLGTAPIVPKDDHDLWYFAGNANLADAGICRVAICLALQVGGTNYPLPGTIRVFSLADRRRSSSDRLDLDMSVSTFLRGVNSPVPLEDQFGTLILFGTIMDGDGAQTASIDQVNVTLMTFRAGTLT